MNFSPIYENNKVRCRPSYGETGKYADVNDPTTLGYNRKFLQDQHYPPPGGYFMRRNPRPKPFKLAPLNSDSFIFVCDKRL